MREIHRTLTTKVPILAISVTCGCALNFGQVNASGTVNASANADTKIENNVDTTINASASTTVTQNGGTQQTASPVPSATPASDPGPGTLYVHHVPKMSGPDSGLGTFNAGNISNNMPMMHVYLTASNDRDQFIEQYRVSQDGDTSTTQPLFVNLRLKNEGVQVAIVPETVSGAANFYKEGGHTIVPAGKTITAYIITDWSYKEQVILADGTPVYRTDLWLKLFAGHSVRLKINSKDDIKTLGDAKIEGDFPLYGPKISFCCK